MHTRYAMSRRGVFLGGLAVAFFTGRAARAAPSGSAAVELTWDAPAGCASAPEVRAAVGRLVGASATARSSLDVHGRVREESGRFLVILDVGRGDERSRRSIIAPSCELATDAAVVVIAMLVPAGAPAPRAVAPAPPSDALPPAPDATNALRPAAPSIWLGLGGSADAGMFRTMAPGLVGSVAWRAPRRYGVRAAFGGSSTPERPIHLWHMSARGELSIGEPTALGVGAGFDAGLLHGREADRAWFAVCGGPLFRQIIAERFALGAALDLVVPLAGPTARISNDPEYSPQAVAARGTISFELGF